MKILSLYVQLYCDIFDVTGKLNNADKMSAMKSLRAERQERSVSEELMKLLRMKNTCLYNDGIFQYLHTGDTVKCD